LDILLVPDVNKTLNNNCTFALAGPSCADLGWIADLFVRNAEGNAFAEDRVVISSVESSNSQFHVIGSQTAGRVRSSTPVALDSTSTC